ncbi:class I adenylate-forming enzyme family protein [Gordonia phosphorivorans]|uniref:Class I adenylate-forming enzyme family protein n=1 Tax=Gordonia phosphorivorans TaxID=1056982 RepID=A0ABV6H9Q9_9ACTN
MSESVDPQDFVAAVYAGLSAPGAPFELREEEVLGTKIPVLVNRDRSLGAVLADSLRFGDRDYLITENSRLTFAEHGAMVAAFATALRERYGVGKGDRVGILAANTPEWLVAFWAAQALGAIAVGYNSWWAPREVAYAVESTEPSVIVADAKRAAILADGGVDVPVITMEEAMPALLEEFAGAELPQTEVDEEDPAVILFTSGTSGRPKGAVHSQRNVLGVIDYHRHSDAVLAAFTGAEWSRETVSERRYLLTSPLFHIASLHNLALPRLASGGAVVIYQGAFDPERALALVAKEKVTNWAVVPTMAQRILDVKDLEKFDLSAMSAFALASAPSSPALQQRLRERLPFAQFSLVDSYGMTECATAIAVATPLDLMAVPGNVGRPVLGVQMELRDPEGNRVPDGELGEVCVRSAYVMLGYWNDPQATAAAITKDRWLRTGDYGMIDGGRLFLTGRRSDLILRGGENIYPLEVEQVLDEHPAVAESLVLGIDDADLGSTVGAVVVLREDLPSDEVPTEQELTDFTAERLAYFKVPAQWRITSDPLPRNATGKTMRAKVSL